MAKPLSKPKSLKAQITRTSLVLAAAALLRERGPEAVTYRKVASRYHNETVTFSENCSSHKPET